MRSSEQPQAYEIIISREQARGFLSLSSEERRSRIENLDFETLLELGETISSLNEDNCSMGALDSLDELVGKLEIMKIDKEKPQAALVDLLSNLSLGKASEAKDHKQGHSPRMFAASQASAASSAAQVPAKPSFNPFWPGAS